MKYKTIVVTPASTEPVVLAEACSQLRINIGDDDDHVNMLISMARDKAESYCNRYFTEQVIKIVFFGAFPQSGLDIPFPDLASVDSIKYIDADNAEITLDPGDYSFFADSQVIYPTSTFPGDAKSYTVTVTTGAPAELNGVKAAILMMMTDLYELRTESVVGFSVSENPAVANMLWPYRVNLGV